MIIMETVQTEGIITSALAFKEYDRIITLFTPHQGLIKVVVQGAFSKKLGCGSSTVPLTCVEATCTRKKSELYTCKSLEVINSHLGLRNQLLNLQAACSMLQVVTATQSPERSTESLYQLLKVYLQRLPEALNPHAVLLSFKLKTMRHEGVLCLPSSPTIEIQQELHDTLLALCYSLDFSLISSLQVPSKCTELVDRWFERSLM